MKNSHSSKRHTSNTVTPVKTKDRTISSDRRVSWISKSVDKNDRTISSDCGTTGTPKPRANIAVIVPTPVRKWEYVPIGTNTTVNTVLGILYGRHRETMYKIEYEDGIEDEVSLHKLLSLKNGQKKLNFFNDQKSFLEKENQNISSPKSTPISSPGKRPRRSTRLDGFLNSSVIDLESEEESDKTSSAVTKNQQQIKSHCSPYSLRSNQSKRTSNRIDSYLSSIKRKYEKIDSGEDIQQRKKIKFFSSTKDFHSPSLISCKKRAESATLIQKKKSSTLKRSDSESDELGRLDQKQEQKGSFIKLRQKKHRGIFSKRDAQNEINKRNASRSFEIKDSDNSDFSNGSDSFESSSLSEKPSRRSIRKRSNKNMKECNENEEIYAEEDSSDSRHIVANTKEFFPPIEKDSLFRKFHRKICDVCNENERSLKKGLSPFVYCQGCSTSIHKNCLGSRSRREHLVTKIGPENFVLQCRRCIGSAITKDKNAPRLDVCIVCREIGPSCRPFSTKMNARQEEKLRLQNEGIDPITKTPCELVNNEKNILFRCCGCKRASHFEHLPPLKKQSESPVVIDNDDDEKLRQFRLNEYSLKWRCEDCLDAPATVDKLVCWRPLNHDQYENDMTADKICEDEKEYLIKWSDKSYFNCTWMPGNWVWGVTQNISRKAFLRRDEGINLFPKWSFEEAVPEEFLQIEIVLDTRYEKSFISKSEKLDKLAINDVTEVFVKLRGLPYDEAVWMKPPTTENMERYQSFVTAYNEYVDGKYFRQSPASAMEHRLGVFRRLNFAKSVEMKKQPSQLTGGKMMEYQMEGLNWLLYNFHQKKNVILADEMGLGKTIQIIAFIVAIVKNNPKCWPFLVVTPNSTCPNWRREIKKWAPKLRVVSYYGTKRALELAYNYEMYPENCSDLRAHVVVTSFEGPVGDHSKRYFARIKWAGLIVDEGQRLKNDRNLLHGALMALKIPFQVLLTGTPLQNNKRELFNLLQFLDTSINAAKLDEEYEELTNKNLPQLHDLIRPFFLRRTKLQVLNFLPPMAQMIVPVTMSIVQKKLYKSILAKNPELIKSVFGQNKTTLRPSERGNLNNILMQLRKCLCHPFLYSSAIEDRSFCDQTLYRNLVDASSKFQLLELMLPKLHERGHRILIFSQFLQNLDLIEDFLTGLGLLFQRLDGSMNSLEKQKRIDAFNAPNSPLFAFLLSTRAGGVGINLATADTVLIMDPDFNPHQDIQALSRAHRIGQEKKVLVIQLMTKGSAEEKIIQIGRKKLALDKALIGNMDMKNDTVYDLESILRFGAEALFNDDSKDDIHYDSASVDKLLDRSLIETENNDQEKNSGTQFSFARIWANDKDSITEYNDGTKSPEIVPQFTAWDKILEQREADAALEAAKNTQVLGRGKRLRQRKNYVNLEFDKGILSSPPKNGESDEYDGGAENFNLTEPVELDNEDEYSGSYETDESNKSLIKKRRSQLAVDRMKPNAFNKDSSNGVPLKNTGKQDQWSQPLNKNFPKNVKTTNSHSSGSQFLQSPQIIKPYYSLHMPNTVISNHGPQHKGTTQMTYLPLNQKIDLAHQLSPIVYSTKPFSGRIPALPSTRNETDCHQCGLAHLHIAKVCPYQASVIQIRLMLDKISKSKQYNHNHNIENILRNLLFEKIKRRKKK
ncbi:CHD3-type chromatin-remodeling factor PICKLE [Erysiphe neolycopersici]|uniref:CHD3-type chromatin-remodeling factor PICKLE n=1 Tax=Erysiphe neolycopersici TaxID=212602 RepID=A0A420HRS0_9PEZI|nr:CHD3-type chromatin-remodeling factor PICKLE [Erysiphe neolycopersici]